MASLLNMSGGSLLEKGLPYDAEIEYLESTGTQWIDTLVNQKETQIYLSVEVNIQVPVLESGEHDIAGSGSGSTPTMGYSNTYYFTWASGGTTWVPKSSGVNWHDNIFTFYTGGGRTFSEDGVIYQSNTSNNFTGGAYNTLFLFASSPNRFPLKCRIKSVKIIIDDIVRFDAIPVRVGTTGYLYDKVSGQLFGNAGTGDFILGVDKGPQNYTEIEYLESTGTQWIDTDIIPNTRLAFTIDLQRISKENADEIALGGRVSSLYDYSLWTGKESVGAHYCKGTDSSSYDTGGIYIGYITDKFCTITVSYIGISVDGNSIYTFPDIPFLEGGGESLAIFALKDSGGYDSRAFRGRIKKVVIELNGIIVRDYIPVRVGNVGYMYDKVSKQLFGNAGTGNFILGPDKHKEFVDLGLPSGTLWAKGNIIKNNQGNYSIGKSTDKGCYFSWGNIDGHNKGEEYNFSQDVYNTTPGATLTGNISPTDAEHDAAVARIGEWCHIPTKDQFVELCNSEYTDIIGTSRDGVEGLLITSKINGNSIFLPDAGLYNGTSLYANGTYWSSTFSNEATAYYLFFFSGTTSPTNTVYRCWGLTVRPVIS